MIPILYEKDEIHFTDNGLGFLSDASACTVEEKRNDSYELTMSYPVTGVHFDQLEMHRIIFAKPNMVDDPQPFRIYKINKPISGIVEVNAQHVCYDLSGYPVTPFTGDTFSDTLGKLTSQAVVAPPFSFYSDGVVSNTDLVVENPKSIRSVMEDIIETYSPEIPYNGGEWSYNRFGCTFHAQRGTNRGVVIRYGKNLTDVKQEEECSNVYSGVYPYYKSDSTFIECDPKIIITGYSEITKVEALDLSSEFDATPTSQELQQKAEVYIAQNNMVAPLVSLTASLSDLGIEQIALCDTVVVYFQKLGVSANAKCISIKYDVLKERITSCELGDARKTLADTIAAKADTRSIYSTANRSANGQQFDITIAISDWNGSTSVTKQVSGLVAAASHIVFAGILTYDPITTNGSITFHCTEVPASEVSVSIMQLKY